MTSDHAPEDDRARILRLIMARCGDVGTRNLPAYVPLD